MSICSDFLHTHLGAIAEFMRGQIDFSKATLAYKFTDGIVPHRLEISCGEFTVGVSESGWQSNAPGARIMLVETYSRSCLYEFASCCTFESQPLVLSLFLPPCLPACLPVFLPLQFAPMGFACCGAQACGRRGNERERWIDCLPSSSGPESQPGL